MTHDEELERAPRASDDRAAQAPADRIAEILTKDRIKTREINVLLAENREQAALIEILTVEKAGAFDRAHLLLAAKDKWMERATAAEAALAAETERCAKVCEDCMAVYYRTPEQRRTDHDKACEMCATAIRAGDKT